MSLIYFALTFSFITLLIEAYLLILVIKSRAKKKKIEEELEEAKILNAKQGKIINSVNDWILNQPTIIRNSLLNSVHKKKINADNVIFFSDFRDKNK